MKIKHLMTTDMQTVGIKTPILSAVELLVHKKFNGIPVINRHDKLLGLLTQHDMMLRGTDLHLPTLIRILTDVGTYGKDRKFMSAEMQKISGLKTSDIMNPHPFTLGPEQAVEDALTVFAQHSDVNPILIIDEKNTLVGILSRYDMIKLFGKKEEGEHYFGESERKIDKELKKDLSLFEKRFLFVSRMRTHHWLFVSAAFFIIGVFTALLIMLRFV